MKLLDVTEFYSERGGGVRSHLTLKHHVLCQLGHDHRVVAPRRHDGPFELLPPGQAGAAQVAHEIDRARGIGIAGPKMPYDPTYHLLYRLDKIVAVIEAERPDVLEIHSPYAAAMGALLAPPSSFGVRTMQWHSDFIDTYRRTLVTAMTRRDAPRLTRVVEGATDPLWGLVRQIAKRCEAVLVASKWQVAKLNGHGVPHVVHQPFGLEQAVFSPSARSESLRRDLQEGDPSRAIVVAIGRFAIEKRWDVVLDAFFRVADRRPATLVLLGDGPERRRMEARAGSASARGKVVFRGFEQDRSALARTLASADVLLHGCPYETFGLSVAEGLACGLPAVVPNEGGAAEVVDAAVGAHYPAGDVTGAAAQVLALLVEPRDVHGRRREAAASKARSFPTVEAQFASQIELYRELLARKRASSR